MAGVDGEVVRHAAREIQMGMNPHPAGQMELNVPVLNGAELPGCQHKYRETVLFFPRAGQTCHAYCTYCFRWPIPSYRRQLRHLRTRLQNSPGRTKRLPRPGVWQRAVVRRS